VHYAECNTRELVSQLGSKVLLCWQDSRHPASQLRWLSPVVIQLHSAKNSSWDLVQFWVPNNFRCYSWLLCTVLYWTAVLQYFIQNAVICYLLPTPWHSVPSIVVMSIHVRSAFCRFHNKMYSSFSFVIHNLYRKYTFSHFILYKMQ